MSPTPAPRPDLLERLTRLLDVPGVEYVRRSWNDSRFAGVNLLLEGLSTLDQPARASDETVLFVDGLVTNAEDAWRGEFGGSGEAVPTVARACLDLYRRHGDRFVELLAGQFNIVVYDPVKAQLKVCNDRFAYRPFYHTCKNGFAVIAAEKKAIFGALGRTPEFDPQGLVEFMVFGHNLGDRTVHGDVKVLPPATIATFSRGSVKLERYWAPRYRGGGTGVSLRESAVELANRLNAAAARYYDVASRYGILLSGGLDSRAAAGALSRSTRDVTSFTFGSTDSRDFRFGRDLAAAFRFSHQRLSYEHVSLEEMLPRVVWRTECTIPFNQPLSIAHHAEIRRRADVVFNGHFGDVLTGGHILPGLFRVKTPRQLARHILSQRVMNVPHSIRPLFRRDVIDSISQVLLDEVTDFLRATGENSMVRAYNVWDMSVRQPRFTFCSPAVDRYIFEAVTPFVDYDVVDWMLQLPMHHLFMQRAYRRAIVRGYPESRSVPWARTGRPIATNTVSELWQEGARLVRRRLYRGNGRARAVGHTGSRAIELFSRRDWIDELPGDIFDREGVAAVAEAAAKGSAPADPIFLALTVSGSRRLFGSVPPATIPAEALPSL